MEKLEILLYATPESRATIEVFFEQETFWLSQKKMAELFGVNVRTINEHLLNIFKSGELSEDSVIRNFRITADDGKNYNTKFYNLDTIIATGYRVNSMEATRFRIWATRTLREYIIKGFVMDDERLKQGKSFGRDYFEELLERIREIRASERRFYQKITDIYAQCSADYDPQADTTLQFYKTVQNKLHWAITGQTAAEIVYNRVSAEKPNIGLTTWKHAPDGKILRTDVSIAKNYLAEKELSELNRIVVMYLDYAEHQAKRQTPMAMQDWVTKLDGFLQFNDYKVLKDAGRISHEIAKQLAEGEYEQYRQIQDALYESDFDKDVRQQQNIAAAQADIEEAMKQLEATEKKNKKDEVMALTLQYCSDLHLEFELNRKWIGKYPLAVMGDVLLLGGDIMLFAQQEQHNDFLDFAAANYKATYWIPGNHEYYHSDIAHRSGTLHEAVRENVFLVNNTTIDLGDTDLVCSTLWSHISPAHEWQITRAMNDFKVIKSGENRLSAATYNLLHEQATQFVREAMERSTAKHKVVMTHHVPTLMNYPPKYKGDALNEAFATEMHDFIEACGADYWLYGHTHYNTPDFKIGNTRMLTNQLGYVQYGENKHFDNAKTFTLG